ncbi:sucrose phosphorylase [Spirochaetia bacterium]|nr:sucrose phosphorylase [Spirochaetia bacterium]
MKETSKETFGAILAFLYGVENAASVLPRLLDIIDRFGPVLNKADRGVAQTPPFTHKDAFLITYGDMLSGGADTDESGLTRLYDFLEKRNDGSFSYLHLLPFHPYSSDDGFSVIDYREVDPRFGSWADLEKLAELDVAPDSAGKNRKVKLVFDLVINHGSVQSRWFKGFLADEAKYSGWYITRPENYDYSAVVRPRTHPLLTPFTRKTAAPSGEETVHVWTTFSADQVDYDFSNPDVLLEFVTILLEYAGRGAGIVRLDAIAYLWKEDGASCLHHPKTHAVVKLFRAVIDYLGLPLLILTETNVPHAENISYFGKNVGNAVIDALPEAHMVYNFALPPLCLYAAISGDAGPLREWVKTLPGPESGQYFLNFLASHDGVGLTPAKGLVDDAAFAAALEEAKRRGALVSYKSTPAGDVPYELNCSYASLVAPPDADWALASGAQAVKLRARAFLAVNGVLLSLSGLPAVYFHSWIGSEAWTQGPALLGYNRAINREKPPLGHVEAELDDSETFHFHVYRGLQKIMAFRQGGQAFNPDYEQIVLDAEGPVFALLRRPANVEKGGEAGGLLCLVNLSPKPAEWRLSGEDVRRGYAVPQTSAALDPWESLWLSFADGAVTLSFSTAAV